MPIARSKNTFWATWYDSIVKMKAVFMEWREIIKIWSTYMYKKEKSIY